MGDDELDTLYWVELDAFTAQRASLAAAAKKRGDDAAAKRISSARKPTTAAWMVNRLALRRKDTGRRLSDLGDRLRAAHAAMDGERIRQLSAEQRRLIDELARAAFEAADMKRPSPSVREDLTSTLQAAIADPDVAKRLGRLAKAEQWSGFGALGDTAPTGQTGPTGPTGRAETAAQRRMEKSTEATEALAVAERAQARADDTLSQRRAEREVARRRRDEALATLREAERLLNEAEAGYDEAKRASRAAAESVREAKAQLKRP